MRDAREILTGQAEPTMRLPSGSPELHMRLRVANTRATIRSAKQAVEGMGDNPRLNEAAALLECAMRLIAEFGAGDPPRAPATLIIDRDPGDETGS